MVQNNITDSEKYIEILKAATDLFSEKGLERTTVNEIATKANVGKGTVYLYFKSKNEIFETIISIGIKQTSDFFSNLSLVEDPIQQLRDLIREFFESLTQHQKLFKIIVSTIPGYSFDSGFKDLIEQATQQIQTNLTEFFQHFIDTGVFRQSDPKFLACIFWDFFSHFPTTWIISENEQSLNEMVDPLIDFFLNGAKQ